MTESLDNILSGSGEAVSQTETLADGKSAVEENVAQAEGESQQQAEAEGNEGQQQGGQRTVPHEALHAEKQKVKRYTEEVSSLRQEIADRDAAWERRIAQLVEAQKPKAEPQQKPDWFENPEAATQHAVRETISPQLDQVTTTLMATAQMVAGIKYGDDKVAEAEQAFLDAMRSQKLDPADYHKVANSPNRYASAVQWHQRQLAQAEIGDDPAAYKAKLEAEVREKVLAELQQGEGQQTQQRQAAMPSNFASARNVANRSAGPAWSGPASIQDIFKR